MRRFNKVIRLYPRSAYHIGFQEYRQARLVSEEKYTGLACTKFYAVKYDWEVVSVLTSSPNEEVVTIGGPGSSRSFFTIQSILSHERAVWIVAKGMLALASAGEMTYRIDRSATIQVVKMTKMMQQVIETHVRNCCRLRHENATMDHHFKI